VAGRAASRLPAAPHLLLFSNRRPGLALRQKAHCGAVLRITEVERYTPVVHQEAQREDVLWDGAMTSS
jgi:hypothetical protein